MAMSPISTSTSNRSRPPAKRVRRSCPIPGCTTRNVLKLADHIRVQHPPHNNMADIKNTQYEAVTINKLSLTEEDFRRLKEGEWLNCKLLEAYFSLVAQECGKNGVRIKTLSSLFWSQFEAKGYQGIKHWIAKDDILIYDILFTLIHTNECHWTLMYMNLKMKRLWHLDPLTGKPMEKMITQCKKLIDNISRQTWMDWDLNPERLPLQTNTRDCGLFVCKYALYLTGISAKDVKFTREQMFNELIKKTLIRQETKTEHPLKKTTLLHYFSASKASKEKLGATKEDGSATTNTKTLVVHPLPNERKTTCRTGKGNADNIATAMSNPILPGPRDSKTVSAVKPIVIGDIHVKSKDMDTSSAENKPVSTVLSGNDDESEGFVDTSNTPHPMATPKEKYFWGLLKGQSYSRSNVIVMEVPGRGRSAFAAKPFMAGDFVCNYGGVVRKKVAEDWGDERNASLGLGCYCLDAVYAHETYVFDATASINDPGRYINHASRNYNLVKMQAVMVGEPPKNQLKIGFVAKQNISFGEELFFDYGIKHTPEFPWLTTDAKKVATTLQALQSAQTVRSMSPISTSSRRSRPPAKRVRRSCPIPGCTTRNVLKLADHIRVQHPRYSQAERRMWLQEARKARAHRQDGPLLKAMRTLNKAKPVPIIVTVPPEHPSHNHASLHDHPDTASPDPSVEDPSNTALVTVSPDLLVENPPLVMASPDPSHSAEDPPRAPLSTVTPNPAMCHFDYEGFHTYLNVTFNKSNETVMAISKDIEIYLKETKTNETDTMKLLNLQQLEAFLKVMKDTKKFKPTTRATKIRRLKLALKYILRNQDDQEVYHRGNRVINALEEWCHGLGRDISIQRQQHAVLLREKLHQITDPNEFLDHPMVKEKLSKAFSAVHTGNQNKRSIDIVTAYSAAVVLYGNGQRSGVITNLTIGEFEMREEGEDELVVIPCVHHKTGTQGLAQLVISEDDEDLLIYYYETIRSNIVPAEDSCKNLFFVTFNGTSYTQVYRRMREVLSVGKIEPPQPSHYRVLISSESRRYLDEQKRRNVIKHLSHSMQTSEKYYEFMDTTDATEAHATIHRLSQNRRWSRREITLLTERWPLSGNPPLPRESREFIKEFGLTRSAKDVCYKWQLLAR